ncbi:alpha/beta hydrolase family protein [Shewanella intestini]|uniref:S9 family peptidase n=1 Tax=Shewanella intestini TaxID=2017544 RepID=A0ABS5I4H6_9GAMM|nr:MULTISPECIES: prolyl oligopeptidase family serine peptidase [Shewanella]MBR9728811.1 S9 family peptidase [Shewanella intestini]MRG36886.1 prolyl oligopeptidase family serine peptidase [Shewanella sp. XMDDZSB0408]
MKAVSLVCASLALAFSGISHGAEIDKTNIQRLGPVAVSTSQPLSVGAHSDVLRSNLVQSLSQSQQGMTLFGDDYSWHVATKSTDKSGWVAYKVQISTERYTQGTLTVAGLDNPQVYVNGELLKSGAEAELNLRTGDYQVLVLADGRSKDVPFSLDWQGKAEIDSPSFVTTDTHRVSYEQLFDSKVISALTLSPNGKYLLQTSSEYLAGNGDKATKVTELVQVSDKRVLYRWQDNAPTSAVWAQDSKQLAFVANKQIQRLNIKDMSINVVSSNVDNVSNLQWFGDNLLFSWQKPFKADEKATTKRFQALQDRWSYWRNNSQVYLLDVDSGFMRQLTHGKLSSNLLDQNAASGNVLITRSPVDYKEPAHSLTQLIELNVNSLAETLIGEYRTFNHATYTDDGMYIMAGPDFMNALGVQDKSVVVNNYDGQLYWRSNDGNVVALSKDFDPAIGAASKLDNDDLVLRVSEGDRGQLYLYDFSRQRFNKLKTGVDMVNRFSVASGLSKPVIAFAGVSATVPQKAYLMKSGKKTLMFDSQAQSYANTRIGQIQDFDFTNKHGHNIDGRVYLPTDFDANKKYPALVYYYGGTSPVTRNFTGRWPFNLWAAQGYVVYVLQPNGATGYGQAFSGRHVNAWGDYSADDIIEGTQAFLKAHSFVDPKRVGNMGASYGGFMTMYLATKTDIFAASMAHAGISNLSAYWGYGWWGYGYSGVASKGSFPWNNRDLYVEHSPLYHADKINTPLLLLHGNADTNVPVGESHYMYTALKMLDKPVELIEFNGQDHHINGRQARFDWWDVTLAWFDMQLKDQPQWWNALYPETKATE